MLSFSILAYFFPGAEKLTLKSVYCPNATAVHGKGAFF